MMQAAEQEMKRIRDMRKMIGFDVPQSVFGTIRAADSYHKMFGGILGSSSSALAMASANIGRQIGSIGGLSSAISSIMARQARSSGTEDILAGLRLSPAADYSGINNSLKIALDLQKSARAAYAMMDLKGLYAITESPIAKLLAQIDSSNRFYEGISAGVAGSWTKAFDPELLSQLQTEFKEEVEERPDADIGEVVEAAVLRAFEKYEKEQAKSNKKRSDPRFIAGMILSLLLFLYSWMDARPTALDATGMQAEQIAHTDQRFERQERLMELMLTKDVIRGTRVWSKPDSGSRVLGRIEKGASVIKIQKKGKWVQVALRAEDAPGGVAVLGWMLSKYLTNR